MTDIQPLPRQHNETGASQMKTDDPPPRPSPFRVTSERAVERNIKGSLGKTSSFASGGDQKKREKVTDWNTNWGLCCCPSGPSEGD